MLDASSIVYAWDNYPPGIFGPLWTWMRTQVAAGELQIPNVALGEVNDVEPDCSAWLRDAGVTVIPIGGAELIEAARIKTLLGIVADQYGGGVGENDLFIIATARLRQVGLMSNEERQPQLPRNMSRYKIPAVCAMNTVNVPCESFLEFLKATSPAL